MGWIELSVFIRKRSGSICLCPREISNLYLLRLLAEAAGGCCKDRLANASLEAGWMRPLSSNRPFAKMLLLLHSTTTATKAICHKREIVENMCNEHIRTNTYDLLGKNYIQLYDAIK